MSVSVECRSMGPVSANCYIVTDDATGKVLVVDPGDFIGDYFCRLSDQAGEPDYILLTHGHFDHILGLSRLKESYGGKVVIHEQDEDCLRDPFKSLAGVFGVRQEPMKADITVRGGDVLPFGESEIRVIHTPGHTKGSVCYRIGNCLFSGDTLFCGSAGRTDFPGGSSAELSASLHRLKMLEGDLTVYPGHEEFTTLERERKTNPFMK